jgi:hypothetical protein
VAALARPSSAQNVVRFGVIIPALPESVGHLAGAAHGDGGEMLFKIGLVLLLAWLLGVIGVYSVSSCSPGLSSWPPRAC